MFSFQPEIKKYVVVNSMQKLKKLSRIMSGLEEFAFDTETNTLRVLSNTKDFRIVGISISWGAYNNYYIPLGHRRVEDADNQLPVDKVVKYLKPVFEREDVRIIGHNLKFDFHVIARLGIFVKTRDVFDTMIASWLCDENSPNGLKENSKMYLGIDQTHFSDVMDTITKDIKKQYGLKSNERPTFDLSLIEIGAPYALADAFYTWELYLGFQKLLEVEHMDKIYYRVYVPFMFVLFKMEETGVTVDVEKLKQMNVDIDKDLEELQYQMYEIAGCEFNPSSSAQLAELIFGYTPVSKPANIEKQTKLVQKAFLEGDEEYLTTKGFCIDYDDRGVKQLYPIKGDPTLRKHSFKFRAISTTATGAPQTNSEAFWQISQMTFKTKRKQEGVQLCKLLLEYKKLDKLKSAFITGLLEQLYDDGRAHPSFNIIGTDSGRLSCSNPNLQQLPKADEEDKYQIRSLFIGSVDPVTQKRKKIVALDFANLEMRVLAHFSEDKNLLTMFKDGADTHGSTAVNMFNLDCDPSEVKKKYPHLRQAAKVLNFLLMYGGGAFRLYNALKSDHFSPVDLSDKSYLDTYHVKTGEEVAQIYIDKYFDTYSGVAKFIKDQKRFAHKHGYVYTLLKRKRRLPEINSNDYKMVAYCERLAVNSAVQGSAADITMSAQNRVMSDPWFEEHRIFMLIQVHDELVFECPEEYVEECIKKVQQYMSHPFGDNVELNLPMRADADFGDSYQEAK